MKKRHTTTGQEPTTMPSDVAATIERIRHESADLSPENIAKWKSREEEEERGLRAPGGGV